MLVTSWCLTLWYSFCKSPLIVCFSLFAITKERHSAIYKRQWLPDASVLTVLKQSERKARRILICLLFIFSLWPRALAVWALIPHQGRHSSWGTSLLCSLLCQLGVKAICLFPPKNIYFHKGIRFLRSCFFLHCFKTVSRLIFWKEGSLFINADCRSGTAKVEKKPFLISLQHKQ